MKDFPSLKKRRPKKFTKRAKAKAIATAPLFSLPLKAFLHKHDSDIQLILFPLILCVILIFLFVINHTIASTIATFSTTPIPPETLTRHNAYPVVKPVPTPFVSAQSAIIVDRDSQAVVFSKNPQVRFSMASTTKIMTALTALDYYSVNDVLTIKRPQVEGSGLHLVLGEQFHFLDLLYAMLLPSANDAAAAIADNYPGGNDAFMRRMNEKAQSLHLANTHFADPTGLEDDGDYTTVVDMARLASRAESNPTFVQVTSTKYHLITSLGGQAYELTNLNRLLGTQGVIGIKTGTTEGAGEVLVTSTVKNGHTFIIVVMLSTDRFTDTTTLLHFIDDNVSYISL
jgi:D-alanyl-D-alanine carboxypeptidase